MRAWRVTSSKVLTLDVPRVLGIVNVTPDSFSDGGEIRTPEDAGRVARAMMEAGACGVDIGGESTRPGAVAVSSDEQIARVVPAIAAVRRAVGDEPVLTIDTTSSAVARAAMDAGADAINDVSAGMDDAAMLGLAARERRGVILMHRLRAPKGDSYSTAYADAPEYSGGVVSAVVDFLRERTDAALHAGVAREAIVLDPGLGFGKTVGQNLDLIRRSGALCAAGYPILSALSRKSFTARAAGLGDEAPPRERIHASLGLSVVHLGAGARLFRVHDVASHVQALRAALSVLAGDTGGGSGGVHG